MDSNRRASVASVAPIAGGSGEAGNSSINNSCRIERKRAHDREAQRQSRAKTKAYISHLEKTVAELSESNGDVRANYLAKHASNQAQEIEILQSALNKIRGLLSDIPGHLRGVTAGVDGDGQYLEGNPDLADATSRRRLQWDGVDVTSPSDRIKSQSARPQGPGAPDSARNLVVLGVNMLCEEVDDTTYYARVNMILEKVEQTQDRLSTYAEDQDILVRAIVHGWDSAEKVHHFDIAWRVIRAFDEGCWWRAGAIERLTNFWQLRTIMLNKIRPADQDPRPSPSFMAPTARQLAINPHVAIADYFSWPDIRDHVIVNGAPRVSGRAVIAFAESFRFIWPYELRDAYIKNSSNGMHELSERFLRHFNDLTCYRVVPQVLIQHDPHIAWASLGSPSTSATPSDEQSPQQYANQAMPMPGPSQSTHIPGSMPSGDMTPGVGSAAPQWSFGLDPAHADPRLLLEYAMDPMAINPDGRLPGNWPPI